VTGVQTCALPIYPTVCYSRSSMYSAVYRIVQLPSVSPLARKSHVYVIVPCTALWSECFAFLILMWINCYCINEGLLYSVGVHHSTFNFLSNSLK
jgi:hypothetical protein